MKASTTLGSILRSARKRLHRTQRAVARSIGVSTRTVVAWEHAGVMPTPLQRESVAVAFVEIDHETWRALVEALGLSLDAMLAKVPTQAALAAASSPRTSATARAALDDALRVHAEMLDVTARRLRLTVASLLVDIDRLGLSPIAARDLVIGGEAKT